MSKYINQSQITGEKGVAAFYKYCANHVPYIIFREEAKSDFGVDGEIEFTCTNSENRKVVIGEILKVQIKSTETGSYIFNETDTSFEFKARNSDIEYWEKHKIGVVLIIYFAKTGKLYARKINNLDYLSAKTNHNVILTFSKKDNLIEEGDNTFQTQYSHLFKARVNYDIEETLYTNILPFNTLPRNIYIYNSKISSIKDIFKLNLTSYPIFVMYSSNIYTFIKLDSYPEFINNVLKSKECETVRFSWFLKEPATRNYGIELLNKYFRKYCSEKKVWFNKEYNRFYFAKSTDKVISTKNTSSHEKKFIVKSVIEPKTINTLTKK